MNTLGQLYTPPKSQRGITMIEVLIALLIFAIGLLGVAGMQSLALKSTNNSNIRTLVNIHAYEIAERMRANMPGVESGSYNSISSITGAAQCSPGCTPQQLAALDGDQWLANLQAEVPSVTSASVAYADGVATINIDWTERGYADDTEEQSYTLRARID